MVNFDILVARGIGLALVGLGFTSSIGAQGPSQPATRCEKGAERVFIGTYGHLDKNQGSPLAATHADQAASQGLPSTQGIYSACLNEKTGHLSVLGLSAEVQRSSWLALNPAMPVLYSTGVPGTALNVEGNIYSYGIDPASATLKKLGQVGSGGMDPTDLAIDAPSKTVFVANHGDGYVTALPILADGSLGPVASKQQDSGKGPTPRQSGPEAHAVVVDPSHRYVLSADFGADRIFVYHFDPASRALSPAAVPFEQLPAGVGPRHLAFHPDGKLVVLDTELGSSLVSYRWNAADGSLKLQQTTSVYKPDFAGKKGSPAEILFSKDGKFLYLSMRDPEDALYVYSVQPETGVLTEVQRVPAEGTSPWDFALDPAGHWLVAANVKSNSLTVFKVDHATGKLESTKQSVPMLEPDSVAFSR